MFDHWNAEAFQKWEKTDRGTYRRVAGLNEAGFHSYVASDVKAPSDIFMRTRCRIDKRAVTQERMLRAWTSLRQMHPLLDATFVLDAGAPLYDLRIEYDPNHSEARAKRDFLWLPMFKSWDDERNRLTNCERVLNDRRLSQLRVYQDPSSDEVEIVWLIHHAVSDGASVTMATHDLLNLMASDDISVFPDQKQSVQLPLAMEGCFPQRVRSPRQRWRNAILYIIAQNRNARKPPVIIWKHDEGETRTGQRVHAFSPTVTRRLLASCKSRGLTVGHLIYATQAIAFAKLMQLGQETIIFAGTPMNARRTFAEPFRSRTNEVVMTLAFLDVFMPAITLTDDRKRNIAKLWTMSKIAKRQVHNVINDDNFGEFAYIMLENRWRGRFRPVLQKPASINNPPKKRETYISYGSSAVGNLDSVLKVLAENQSRLKLLDMNIGMRVRHGETLMHSYTFNGRMTLSVMYDTQIGEHVVDAWIKETADLMEMVLDDVEPTHRI